MIPICLMMYTTYRMISDDPNPLSLGCTTYRMISDDPNLVCIGFATCRVISNDPCYTILLQFTNS